MKEILSNKDKEYIFKLYRECISLDEISKITGIDRKRIMNLIYKHKIKRENPGYTFKEVAHILGYKSTTVIFKNYKNQIKHYKLDNKLYIKEEDLLVFLKNNLDLWNIKNLDIEFYDKIKNLDWVKSKVEDKNNYRERLDFTEYELEYIKRNWGSLSAKTIGKNLGRTETGIKLKAKRLKLGGRKKHFSQREVSELLSMSPKTLKKYREAGIIRMYKAATEQKIYSIRLNDLLKFMEENQDKWDARKLLYEPWLSRPDWFKDKLDKDRLKSEKGNGCRYTKADDRKIIELYRSGKTNKEIAEYMGRSKNGIAHRLTRINYGIGK